MNSKRPAYILLSVFLFSAHLSAQNTGQEALNSITAAELRNHIFFLASDYLNGRVGPSAEYEIAAQYVATQFAAAELEPVQTQDGNKSFFQDVPFVKTVYDDKIKWTLDIDGTDRQFVHRKDFKIVYGSTLNFENTPLVWAGYGIEEPEHKWNDFKNLETEGKIIVFMTGAPVKKDKPVLPDDIHNKYNGQRGFQAKISNLFSKGAAAIIMVDTENSGPMAFDAVTSRFNTETYEYKNTEQGSRRSRPAVFIVKPDFIDMVMGDKPYNPMKDNSGKLKNYQPQVIKDVQVNSSTEVLSRETINTKNVVGMVPGTDPVLRNEYIVVGAHLDHVKPRDGQVCNGADDNASGSAGVIEIAEAV
ncbi:MAG: M28 family peptidase, partial [Bacteroidales bacterium]|nr:M28 family peptidase [Bacteroidales bacterium]